MITIQKAVEEIVANSPFLEDLLSKGMLNLTSTARYFQPDIEKRLYKPVHTGAIVMALQRLSQALPSQDQQLTNILQKIGDLTVRSNIAEFTFTNSPGLVKKQAQLFDSITENPQNFMTITDGVFESSIFCSTNIEDKVNQIFKGEHLKTKVSGLSAITLIIPQEATQVPGVYYSILKTLAWNGISFIEVISSFTELTIILDENMVDRAFTALKRL